jgi:hypothetical protein
MAITKYIVNQIENFDYDTKSKLKLKDKELVGPFSINNLFNSTVDFIDLHFYTLEGTLLKTQLNYRGATQTSLASGAGKSGASNLEINPAQDAKSNGYRNGDILLTYNFFSDLFSDSTVAKNFYLEEVSGDRTEIRLLTLEVDDEDLELRVQQIRAKLENNAYFSDLKLDFGKNNIYSIINIDVQEYKNNVSLVLKLYEPLPNIWESKSICRVLETIADTATFSVITELIPDIVKIPSLKGPNFDVEVQKENNNPTEFFNFDQLFSFPVTSSYYSLYSLFNENSAQISINHSDYSDFIHFSSAEERLRNFKYKLELIQSYETSIKAIESTGYKKIGISGSKDYYNGLLQGIVENFDHYDRYLYYESGSYAWPKSNNKAPYVNQSSDTVESTNWFTKQLTTASVYDNSNDDVLTNTLPLYVRDDESNEPILMFTHMIGQHFDNLWIYFKAVSDKYDADNRLDFGISKDLVRDAIESFGYNLYNSNRSLQNLFSAFVGENYDSGSTGEVINSFRQITSGSGLDYLQPMPEDNYQKEIYKRIYHNLPYLTKAKGTHRGLRALINCFGIPDNILTIKQRGGTDITSGRFFSEQEEVTSSLAKLRLNNTGSLVTGSTLSKYVSITNKENKFTDDLHDIEVGFDIAQPTNDIIRLKYSGSYNFDDYIGDPRDSGKDKYYSLDRLTEETFDEDFSPYNFWQWVVLRWEDSHKDVRGNADVNRGDSNEPRDRFKWTDEIANYREPTDYIRLIKFFDNVLFRLVKEFIPARASATTGVIVRSHILHRSKAKQVKVSFSDELITGSVKLLNITGSSGDMFGKANKSPYTTNYESSVISPIGSIPRNMSSEEPRLTGEFSGSNMTITRGELNTGNKFKSQQQPISFFNIRSFSLNEILPLACDVDLDIDFLGEFFRFNINNEDGAVGRVRVVYPYVTPYSTASVPISHLITENPLVLEANASTGEFKGWKSGPDASYITTGSTLLIPKQDTIFANVDYYADFGEADTGLPTPDGQVFVMQVCNSNSAKDDNFDVFLNDNYIGALDLSTNAQVGGVFIGSTDEDLTISPSGAGFVCPLDLMSSSYFDPSYLVAGTNNIYMKNTQRNNNGNFGKLELRHYEIGADGSTLTEVEDIADLTFGGATGADMFLTFNYI